MKTLIFALACLPACFAQQTQLNFSGSISGTVTGSDGTVITGAYVTLVAIPTDPPGRNLQTQWAAFSDANGAFAFSGLYAANYQACAQLPRTQWLNPCAWGAAPPVATLSATQPTATVSVVMIKGVVLAIRVNDPQQLLAKNEGIAPGAHLLMGIGHPPFLFDDAYVATQDSGGRTYQIALPFGFAATLRIYSSFFRLTNSVGTTLPQAATTSIPLTVAVGQSPPNIVLNVTGGGAQ